jgi:type II secretory pathway pseudopilin PulG
MKMKSDKWQVTSDKNRRPRGFGNSATRHPSPVTRSAFTLLEVMFAVIIFFTASFAILALVSQSIDNARRLQRPTVDAGLVAAELSLTNQLVEEKQSGDFGKAYPDYSWTADITEEQTNKLFRVDYVVLRDDNHEVMQKMSVLFFRPQSKAGSLDGATVGK